MTNLLLYTIKLALQLTIVRPEFLQPPISPTVSVKSQCYISEELASELSPVSLLAFLSEPLSHSLQWYDVVQRAMQQSALAIVNAATEVESTKCTSVSAISDKQERRTRTM